MNSTDSILPTLLNILEGGGGIKGRGLRGKKAQVSNESGLP